MGLVIMKLQDMMNRSSSKKRIANSKPLIKMLTSAFLKIKELMT